MKSSARMSGAALGLVLHMIVWAAVINQDSTPSDWECGEISCWTLVVVDIPVSAAYTAGDAAAVTRGSLLVGSLWWSALGAIIGRTLGAKNAREPR